MRLLRGRKQDETLAERDEHLQRLQAECRVLQVRLDDTQMRWIRASRSSGNTLARLSEPATR